MVSWLPTQYRRVIAAWYPRLFSVPQQLKAATSLVAARTVPGAVVTQPGTLASSSSPGPPKGPGALCCDTACCGGAAAAHFINHRIRAE